MGLLTICRWRIADLKIWASVFITDLTVVSYAGPDLGLLCAAGKVKRAVYAFASLDSISLKVPAQNGKWNLKALHTMIVGGSAVPRLAQMSPDICDGFCEPVIRPDVR